METYPTIEDSHPTTYKYRRVLFLYLILIIILGVVLVIYENCIPRKKVEYNQFT
jgi:hypothetical protein